MRDLHNNMKAEVALATATIAGNVTTTGNIIDMQGFGMVEFIIQSANLTDGIYTPLLQEGTLPNLADASSVAAIDMAGTIAGASLAPTDDNTTKKIGYIGNKRYVRLAIVSTGVTSGGVVSAVAIKGRAADNPVG